MNLLLGSTCETPVAHADGDGVDGAGRAFQRIDLCLVLDGAQRCRDGARGDEASAWDLALQGEHEPRPRMVTNADHRCTANVIGDDLDRILGLLPGSQCEHCIVLHDAGCFEAGDDERGVAINREDEHREPFEGHGLIAGEVWQIRADREAEDVDAFLLHPGPSAVDSLAVRHES